MSTDVARGDAFFAVAPDDGAQDVEEAKGERKNAGSNDETSEVVAKIVVVVGWLVQRSENVAANDDHGESKPADAVRVGENRPGVAEVVPHGLQHGKFRNDEDYGNDGSDKERDALKDKVRPSLADLNH